VLSFALQEYLHDHPDRPELLLMQVEHFIALQNLKLLLVGELSNEEWPNIIGE
jgi:hypothetical protein